MYKRQVNHLLRPVDAAAAGGTVRVEIEPGAGARQIASILAEKGVIRSALIFRIYARRHRLEQKFMAGSYDLKLSMSLPEIAAKIASGDVDLETDWFTAVSYTHLDVYKRQPLQRFAEKNGGYYRRSFFSVTR